MTADPIVESRPEGGMGNCQWQQATIAVVNDSPDHARDRSDERGRNIRKMNQGKAEASNQYRPQWHSSRKQGEKSSKKAELQKGLLNECPNNVVAEPRR